MDRKLLISELICRNKRIGFGRFLIAGIPVTAIAERNKAGESILSLAKEYGVPKSYIQAVIQWTKRRSNAAKKGWRTRRAGK